MVGFNNRVVSGARIMNQQTFFDCPKEEPGKLVFKLTVPGRLPSWNEILGMERWARYQFTKDLADAFLSALRHSEDGSSMKIIYAKNTTSTFADTLARYLRMRREQRRLKSLKKRSDLKNKNESKSKSMKSYKVPF